MKTLLKRRTLAPLAALACSLLALVGASSAPGDTVNPVLTLGPTSIANGVASVSGTVTAPDASSSQLTVNGQPLGLNAGGSFAGTANLNGQSALSLAVLNPTNNEVSTVSIPLTSNLVGPGGVVSTDALDDLEQAAASITRPIDGFVSVGGQPIVIGGGVVNRDELAGMTVNGINALSGLLPNGTFAIPVPGTSREMTVLMTDRQGVSLETRYPVAAVSYVTAANAVGVKIAKVRYFTKGVKKTKRVRMVVTIKDKRGVIVRGARVTVKSARTGRVVGAAKVKGTNKKGQTSFVLRMRSKAFGKRVVIVTTAKTPSAKASKRTSVRVPSRAHR